MRKSAWKRSIKREFCRCHPLTFLSGIPAGAKKSLIHYVGVMDQGFFTSNYIISPIIVPEITEASVAPNSSFNANFET